jgi:hypothetical protein
MTWKRASFKTYITFDQRLLIKILTSWYLVLFRNFNLSENFRLLNSSSKSKFLISAATYARMTQFGFGMILRTIADRLKLKSDEIRNIYEEISDRVSSSIMMQGNWMQEAMIALHSHNLCSMEGMVLDPWKASIDVYHARHSGYFSRMGLPTLTTVCLLVPKSVVNGFAKNDFWTPILSVSIQANPYDNTFFGLKTAWVKILKKDSELEHNWKVQCRDFNLIEAWKDDPDSKFMVMVTIPTFALCCMPEDQIKVVLSSPPISKIPREYVLGELFRAKFTDKKHVSVVVSDFYQALPPRKSDVPFSPAIPTDTTLPRPKFDATKTHWRFEESLFVHRIHCPDLEGSTNVEVHRCEDDSKLSLQIGDRFEIVEVPFPVEFGSARVRVSRKSKYVDICIVPVRAFTRTVGDLDFYYQSGVTPRVALDVLPLASLPKNLLNGIVSETTIGVKERLALTANKSDVVDEVREQINFIFTEFKKNKSGIFVVPFDSDDLIIIPVAYRLDIFNEGLVLDSVVCLAPSGSSEGIPLKFPSTLSRTFWRNLIAVSIERARAGYQHVCPSENVKSPPHLHVRKFKSERKYQKTISKPCQHFDPSCYSIDLR